MKKLILSLFCIIGTVIFTSSQAHAQGLGISGGLNLAHFNDVDGAADSRTSLMAGLTYGVKVPMSPVSIRPGLFFTQKGAEATTAGLETSTRINYLEVPVVAKFDFILDNPALTPHVYFGPYVGFLLDAEQETNGSGISTTVDITEQINNTDFGVVVGAGADISKFQAGIRYSAGLSEVAEDNLFDGKNGVFSIVLGVRF